MERVDEFKMIRGDTVNGVKDGDKLVSDVFEVDCRAEDNVTHVHTYLGVAEINDVESRQYKEDPSSLGLDILLFGFDSVSRMTWMRNLPKSHDYFVNTLGGVVMEGYNIVGDGTPQALFPILTGKTEMELPEARRGFPNATMLDNHPWIWSKLEELGYVTQWGEDVSHLGTFTLRMLGFEDQPVDHYMRNFYLVSEKQYYLHPPFCFGSLPRHRIMMNWVKEFLDTYSTKRKFSFNFLAEYSHSFTNKLKWADEDLRNFLEYLKTKGHLDNALLVLMSDHGARFASIRHSIQGKFEERMPYIGVRIPDWVAVRHPEVARNIQLNAKRLTTPFDIHATLEDILKFEESSTDGIYESGRLKRGISLFKEVPLERSCTDAGIEPHWCVCMRSVTLPTDHAHARNAAAEVLTKINSMTSGERAICAELKLTSIIRAEQLFGVSNVVRFEGSKDLHGRVPQFSRENIELIEEFYQVVVETSPNQGRYEVTVMYLTSERRYLVNEKEISRIDVYGDQPRCLVDRLPHLRQFCFCTTSAK